MDYRDNRQRWAESHQVVHFYAGQWCTFTPALTIVNEITKKFPDWRRVLPTDASKEYPWCRSSYNMEKLTAIHKAITLLNGNKTGLDILPGKDSAPAIARHEGPADAVFVIMPKRGSAGVYVPPAWLSATTTKGKAT